MKRFTMKGCAAVGALAILALGGCGQKQPDETASTKAMMAEHVQPTAQVYWNAVQYISDEKGAREIVPQNQAEWDRTAAAATRLADLGRELQQAKYAAGRGADWAEFTRGLVDVAGQAEAAARSHKPEKVLEAGGTLYNVCSACHEVYMPTPAGLSPEDKLKAHDASQKGPAAQASPPA